MEYYYEMNLNDMMNYQELLFLSKKVPSIIDSVKRWEKMVFLLLIGFIPLMIFTLFTNLTTVIVVLIFDSILYILFKKKSTIYYWKLFKGKAEKDLLATYFNNDRESTIPYKLSLFSDNLDIESTYSKKEIFAEDIIFKEITDNYIYFYTSKHAASYIPLYKLSTSKREIISWFLDQRKMTNESKGN